MDAMLEPIARLSRDLRDASKTLSDQEARYLVDSYYQMQDNRIRAAGQIRSMSNEPNLVLDYCEQQSQVLENSVKVALKKYAEHHPVGSWLMSVHGIGPVIAAGLLAHIDISKCNTAAKIWRFAGLDPTVKWEKGQKRPWNAKLKTLCWKAGQSFLKTSNSEKGYYGRMYREHKQQLIARSEAGEFNDYALERAKTVGKSTEAYKSYSAGRLPAGQIDARARRYAVKMFLAALHEVWFFIEHGELAPVPYAIAHLGHKDYRPPVNYQTVAGLSEAIAACPKRSISDMI